MNSYQPLNRLLTEQEAAQYLRLSRSTLRQQRMKYRPSENLPLIPFVRVGRNIRYDISDLDAWIVALKVSARAYDGRAQVVQVA